MLPSELLSDVRFRLRALFRRHELERELDDELRFHVEREAEKYVRQGMDAAEARRRAYVAFGGVERVKEESRSMRGVTVLERGSADVRYAMRALMAKPGFTAAVVLTLALGIGANAAMFGIVDRMLFRAPPYMTETERVHRVYGFSTYRGLEEAQGNHSFGRYQDLLRWSTAFDRVGAFFFTRQAVGTGDQAREMRVGTVSASFFSFFDARPALGRFFSAREDALPAGESVTVLGYEFWQSRYGGRPDALGQALMIGDEHFTIVGVAPAGFVGVESTEVPVAFVPITRRASTMYRTMRDAGRVEQSYDWTWLELLVRRKAGVSSAVATADLTNVFRRSYDAELALDQARTPAAVARPRAEATPVQRNRGPQASQVASVALWTSGVALVVLLIACANVGNLLLARAMQRRREIAVRLALGVSRGRLVAQLLTESLLLALMGGAAGLLVAQWGGAALGALFLDASFASGGAADARTLAFAAAAILVTGVVTGLAPALQSGRDDLASTLKAGAREGTYRRSRVRGALLLVQGALSVVLLVGAGLFVRSLQHVQAIRLGYDVDPVLHVALDPRGVKLTDEARAALARRLRDEAATIPRVESASRALTVPFWNTWAHALFVDGIDSVRTLGSFTLQAGSPEYFRTMGTRVLRGRGLRESDRAGAPGVMLVSEGMARTLWPGKEALGRCVRMQADTMPCTTVVGITEDIRQNSLSEPREYQYYLPIEQFHPERADLFVRVRGEARSSVEAVRRRLQALMPGASYVTVMPLHDIVDPNRRSWRLGATMFSAFGLLSLVLAAIGLYSVIAYDVAQRAHELGVRIALGARAGDVVRLVMGQGVRFAIAGIVVGGAIALAAGRWVEPLLFSQSPRDPAVFAAVTGLLALVAVLASVVPALRASRVDPNAALRSE